MPNIYNYERLDGLESVLSGTLSVAHNIPIFKAIGDVQVVHGKVKSIKSLGLNFTEDVFIYQYPSILVTAGTWNLNDHVFDKIEVWKARATPVGKPTNLSHNPQNVVGHIFECIPITDEEDAKIIPSEVDGKPNIDIPDIYHLLNVDNFYKFNIEANKEKFPEFSKKIEAVYKQIVEGTLSVSMECLFSDFDYAVVDKTGRQVIIKRDEKSSFLSKYLKFFKGDGEYDGYRIGMLLRNLKFIGKGITDDPANPASKIFDKESFMFANASCVDVDDIFCEAQKNSVYITTVNGENKMTLEDLQKLNSEKDAKIAELTKAVEELSRVKTDNSNLTNTVASLTSESDKIKAEKLTVEQEKVKVEASVVDLTAKLDVATKELSTAQNELNTIKAEKVKAERVSAIAEKLDVKKEEAETHYETTASMNDDNFGKWLTSMASIVNSKKEKLEAELKKLNDKNLGDVTAAVANAEVTVEKLGTANASVDDAATKMKETLTKVFSKKK